ncbi:MAG: pseudouridine synthase [Zetaproteobacteria bacterium CG2_30_46_52]|nr:MAG: pseudouridine synthase [Zetaproteobacteria bacterium CG2_30_46_52]
MFSNPTLYIKGSRAPKPSYITLPARPKPLPSLLDFLDGHFPRVGREVWEHRLQNGKVSDESGRIVDLQTPYRINARLAYFREVIAEPRIPFAEHVLFEDEHILLADKPHFMPVTPSGTAVNECLLHRLIQRTGNTDLVPLHRLDKDTAGLVLFSKSPATRNAYNTLFRLGHIDKHYEAVGNLPAEQGKQSWLIESRIEPSGEWILQHNVQGPINARSSITILKTGAHLAQYALSPITGKTHQLRLHMGLIGVQILHDSFYPQIQPKTDLPDYSKPLQLLAKSLSFTDPISREKRAFTSHLGLKMWNEIA